jgi:hypothetical protein
VALSNFNEEPDMTAIAKWISTAALTSALVVVGCDNSDTTTGTPQAAPAPTTPQPAPQADGGATGTGVLDGAMGQAKQAAAGSAEQAREGATVAKESATAAVSQAQAQGSTAVADVTATAEKKLQEVVTYIKENKVEAAETALVEVEKLKPQLPATLQKQVDTARTQLNALKAGGGLKLPGM